jgi:two-component system response regulator PilR (NtrC family)
MSRSRILVADNHQNVREVMSNLLDMLGIDAIPCAGGEQVLQMVDTGHFDAVISDVVMPEMGGLDLVTRLREKKPQLPVIMMSSYASDTLEEEARSRGAVGLVAKPFKLEAVTRLLEAAGVPFLRPA